MDSDLKVAASFMILESKKLSNPVKRQYINFIEHQALCDEEVKCVILDGKVSRLDEKAKQLVNQRWELFLEDSTSDRKHVMSILGILANPIDWVLYRAIRATFDKCSRECSPIGWNSASRQSCMYRCRIAKATKEMGLLSKMCAKSKDKGCKEKANRKKQELAADITGWKKNLAGATE